MTSSPTGVPSKSPSSRPSTAVPSAPPSVTGLVATVTASTSTTEALDSSEVSAYTDSVAEYYGVDADDVSTTVAYSTSGSMVVSVPEGVTEEELSNSVQDSLATALGVHPQNVNVEVDLETGEVTFTVTSDDFETIQEAQFNLENENIQEEIASGIVEDIPEAVVDSISVSEETTATIEFTVDADEASNDVTQAAWQTEQLLSEEVDVEVDSKFCVSLVNVCLSKLRYYGTNCTTFAFSSYFYPNTSTFHYWSCRHSRAGKDCDRNFEL